jgi:hypothetical protein
MVSSSFHVTCPTEGQLRAHQDVADAAVASHLRGCDACTRRAADLRSTAQLAARAIADLDADAPSMVDADAAWAAHPRALTSPVRRTGWREVPASIAAAVVALLVAALLVVAPTARQAAADFLERFRAVRFEVVTFDPSQPMAGVERLADIADVDIDEQEHVVVDSVDEAADIVGFSPSSARTLPDNARAREIMAMAPMTVRATFRAERAPDLPPALDGASLVVSVPGSVVTQYTVGQDILLVGEAGQLVAEAEGADLAAIREYLLNRPEVPEDLARQLLAIDDWTATLPVPVPVDDMAWRETTVAGQPGLMLSDPVGAGLVWQRDGRIHAVGGTGFDVEQLREIAGGVSG